MKFVTLLLTVALALEIVSAFKAMEAFENMNATETKKQNLLKGKDNNEPSYKKLGEEKVDSALVIAAKQIENKNFFQEFTLSFSLNFFSEIGDKSFVSIILIYDQLSPIVLFIVATVCEVSMNLMSVVIGYQLKNYPRMRVFCQFIGMATSLVFSMMLIMQVINPDEDKTEVVDKTHNEDTSRLIGGDIENNEKFENSQKNIKCEQCEKNCHNIEGGDNAVAAEADTGIEINTNNTDKNNNSNANVNNKALSTTNPNATTITKASQQLQRKTQTQSKIAYAIKIVNIAWIILLSELGDKSQITTIVLSTEYNPIPIFLGTACAHVLGIILSMTIGYLISQNTNRTILTAIGAVCFLYFAVQIGMDFSASGGFKALLG